MINVTEQSTMDDKLESKDDGEVNIVIDVNNLTDDQKKLLLVTGLSFVFQKIYLFNLQIFTDLFKGFIVIQYNLAGAYIVSFIATLLPYLLIIFVFIDIYFAYLLLLNNHESMKSLSEIFTLITIILVIVIFMFFITVFSIPTFPPTAFYPTMVELVLFVIVVFFSLFILFLPFGVQKYFLKKIAILNHNSNL